MISRRAALRTAFVAGGVGIAGVGAHIGGVLDEGLRAVGVRPHTEPDPRDVQLLADAARAQKDLLAQLDLLARQHDDPAWVQVRRVLEEQLAAVSDEPAPAMSPEALDRISFGVEPADFADQVEAAAAQRADGALTAKSLAVIKVLAAMAAGLDQVGVTARRLA